MIYNIHVVPSLPSLSISLSLKRLRLEGVKNMESISKGTPMMKYMETWWDSVSEEWTDDEGKTEEKVCCPLSFIYNAYARQEHIICVSSYVNVQCSMYICISTSTCVILPHIVVRSYLSFFCLILYICPTSLDIVVYIYICL
jgi:hypothetical protein